MMKIWLFVYLDQEFNFDFIFKNVAENEIYKVRVLLFKGF